MRLSTIAIFALVAAGTIQADDSATRSKPNIVLVLADDLGWGDVSCNQPGNAYQTPQIDRIASRHPPADMESYRIPRATTEIVVKGVEQLKALTTQNLFYPEPGSNSITIARSQVHDSMSNPSIPAGATVTVRYSFDITAGPNGTISRHKGSPPLRRRINSYRLLDTALASALVRFFRIVLSVFACFGESARLVCSCGSTARS